MNNEIKKIKAALRKSAIEVTVFDSVKYEKNFPTQQYVPLEDALNAVDNVEIIFTSPPCENFSKETKRKTKMLTAYNVATKQKGCPIYDAVIHKTHRGAFIADGHDGKGNKLTAVISEERVNKALEDGVAKWK